MTTRGSGEPQEPGDGGGGAEEEEEGRSTHEVGGELALLLDVGEAGAQARGAGGRWRRCRPGPPPGGPGRRRPAGRCRCGCRRRWAGGSPSAGAPRLPPCGGGGAWGGGERAAPTAVPRRTGALRRAVRTASLSVVGSASTAGAPAKVIRPTW